MQSEPAPTPFLSMTRHGEGVRAPLPGGCVVLSRLGGGSSALQALTPSIKFVLEGEEVYEVEGRTRRLGKGEFLLMEAGVDIRVRTPATEETLGFCVYLPVEQPNLSPVRSDRFFGPAHLAGNAADPLSDLLRSYAQLLACKPTMGHVLAKQIVQQAQAAANAYCSSFERQLNGLRSVKHSTRINTLHRLEKARSYLHAHAGDRVTLEAVAAHAALSRFHLTRSFADVYGMPPLAYHRSLRLDSAAARLRDGEASPSRLSEELGYASLSAFSRAFRQRFGVPPSQARLLSRSAASLSG